MDCVIRNLSERGARLESAAPPSAEYISSCSLSIRLGRVPPELLWQRGRTAGVELPESAGRIGARSWRLAGNGTFRFRRAFLGEEERDMARDLHFAESPLAEEFDVGDDSDLPGYDQPVSKDHNRNGC